MKSNIHPVIWVVLIVSILFVPVATFAEQLSDTEALYHQGKMVEEMIKGKAPLLQIKKEADRMSEMYTQLDGKMAKQSIEGMQAISGELIGLKQEFARISEPNLESALFHVHRLSIAFDALAHPVSAEWLKIGEQMQKDIQRMIADTEKGQDRNLRGDYRNLTQKKDEIALALHLRANPSDVNLIQSTHRFLNNQLQGDSLDRTAIKTALTYYLQTLKTIVGNEKTTVSKEWIDNQRDELWWVGVVLLGSGAWLFYRRMKTS